MLACAGVLVVALALQTGSSIHSGVTGLKAVASVVLRVEGQGAFPAEFAPLGAVVAGAVAVIVGVLSVAVRVTVATTIRVRFSALFASAY